MTVQITFVALNILIHNHVHYKSFLGFEIIPDLGTFIGFLTLLEYRLSLDLPGTVHKACSIYLLPVNAHLNIFCSQFNRLIGDLSFAILPYFFIRKADDG